jgi:hypothetical protein
MIRIERCLIRRKKRQNREDVLGIREVLRGLNAEIRYLPQIFRFRLMSFSLLR